MGSPRTRLKLSKRTPEQREYDVTFCTRLFLKGYTYRDIASQLNEDVAKRGFSYIVNHVTIFNDIKKVLIEWKKEKIDNIDDYVMAELRKLDIMEQEAWQAWEASKVERKKTKEKTGIEGFTEIAKETCAGNPRFLDVLLNIQQRRAKLLGFDAPLKIELPGCKAGSNDDLPKYDVKAIPEDMLFALADKLQGAEFNRILTEKGGE